MSQNLIAGLKCLTNRGDQYFGFDFRFWPRSPALPAVYTLIRYRSIYTRKPVFINSTDIHSSCLILVHVVVIKPSQYIIKHTTSSTCTDFYPPEKSFTLFYINHIVRLCMKCD